MSPAAEALLRKGLELESAIHRNNVDNERLAEAVRARFRADLENSALGAIDRLDILSRTAGVARELAAGMATELAVGNNG